MATITVFVTPDGGQWAVKKTGRASAVSTHVKKSTATHRGRALARRLARQHPRSTVEMQVRRKDGTIQSKHSYTRDPRKIKG